MHFQKSFWEMWNAFHMEKDLELRWRPWDVCLLYWLLHVSAAEKIQPFIPLKQKKHVQNSHRNTFIAGHYNETLFD